LPNQFTNENNILAHYESTGPEIFAQTDGSVDVFVAGMGTTGTLMGVSRFLRERRPAARIVGVEPPIGHRIQGLKNMQEAIRPRIYDASMLHEKISVVDEEAFQMTRHLALCEGIFVGMSSGAAVAGALRIAKRMSRGTIVVLLPDRGDRYLSTEVFQCSPSEYVSKVA
jgi:cysteine synthase B